MIADAQGILSGVPALVDKDLAFAPLARQIGADLLVISTAVEKACLDFGEANQRTLNYLSVAEAKQYIADGHFLAGSMLPKVEACVEFIEQGGSGAIITSPGKLSLALEGRTGTRLGD